VRSAADAVPGLSADRPTITAPGSRPSSSIPGPLSFPPGRSCYSARHRMKA